MKTLLLLVALMTNLLYGSFKEIYQNNRINGIGNLITADFIAYAYANYKLSRERKIEDKILKPRVLNFAKYLYIANLELHLSTEADIVAYTAILYLLSKDGNTISIPDKYQYLSSIIEQEAELIFSANRVAYSPLGKKNIDYREFKVMDRYSKSRGYFLSMKFLQIMPKPKALLNTIHKSTRVNNLYNQIKSNLNQFVGISKIGESLFPLYKGINRGIFLNNRQASFSQLLYAIRNNNKLRERLLTLNSSYDYDLKIVQSLSEGNHINASKGYFVQSRYRDKLYINPYISKSLSDDNRSYADIENHLEDTLNVMIEGALLFRDTLRDHRADDNMVSILKRLRKITQKKREKIPLKESDFRFLNSLDKKFLDIPHIEEKTTVKITKYLTITLKEPTTIRLNSGTIGGRYKFLDSIMLDKIRRKK